MMTRVKSRQRSLLARRRSRSAPFITGMLMSVSNSCTSCDSSSFRASAPSPASRISSTGTSVIRTTRLIIERIIDESSTIKIRISKVLLRSPGHYVQASVVYRHVHSTGVCAAHILRRDEHAVAPQKVARRQQVALAGADRRRGPDHVRAADQLDDGALLQEPMAVRLLEQEGG